MRDATANRIEHSIKQHMPVGAVAYFFQQITADNRVIRFPETGFFKLIAPFEFPVGVPGGTYQVFFVRSLADSHPLPPRDHERPYPEVSFYFAPSPATQATPPDRARPTRSRPRPVEDRPLTPLDAAHLEYSKQRLSLKHQRAEQDLEKMKHYTQEVSEVFTLNQSYRHELADSAKLLMAQPKEMLADLQKVRSVFNEMTEASLDMVAMHRKRLNELANPAPPPPPAYVTVIQTLLPLVVPLGVAAFARFDLASRLPPELMKVLVESLAALTPPAPPSALPKPPEAPALPFVQQQTSSQPALPAMGEAKNQSSSTKPTGRIGSSPGTARDPSSVDDISSLPPLANSLLTVKNLQLVLSILHQPDAPPELKQFLAGWSSLADQMISERKARRRNSATPLAACVLSVQDLHYLLSMCERKGTAESTQLLAPWISLVSTMVAEPATQRMDAPGPSSTEPLLPQTEAPSLQAAELLPTERRVPSMPGAHPLHVEVPDSPADRTDVCSTQPVNPSDRGIDVPPSLVINSSPIEESTPSPATANPPLPDGHEPSSTPADLPSP